MGQVQSGEVRGKKTPTAQVLSLSGQKQSVNAAPDPNAADTASRRYIDFYCVLLCLVLFNLDANEVRGEVRVSLGAGVLLPPSRPVVEHEMCWEFFCEKKNEKYKSLQAKQPGR